MYLKNRGRLCGESVDSGALSVISVKVATDGSWYSALVATAR